MQSDHGSFQAGNVNQCIHQGFQFHKLKRTSFQKGITLLGRICFHAHGKAVLEGTHRRFELMGDVSYQSFGVITFF